MPKKILKKKERQQKEAQEVDAVEADVLGCNVRVEGRQLTLDCTRAPSREEAKRIGVALSGITRTGEGELRGPAKAELSGADDSEFGCTVRHPSDNVASVECRGEPTRANLRAMHQALDHGFQPLKLKGGRRIGAR